MRKPFAASVPNSTAKYDLVKGSKIFSLRAASAIEQQVADLEHTRGPSKKSETRDVFNFIFFHRQNWLCGPDEKILRTT